jgi:hypothetical protein
MPSIPRAPRLPQGLAPRPASSDYPADLAHAAPALELVGSGYSASAASTPPLRDPTPIRPENVGLSHTFSPVRPGSSIAPPGTSLVARPMRWYESRNNQRFVVCLVLAVAFYAYSAGAFRSHTSALELAFKSAGITPGKYDAARHFLAEAGDSFEGLSSESLSVLLEGLERAGATRTWAIEIERRGGSQVSHTLLVELPSDPAGRRTIFFQLARAGEGQPAADTGQAFLRIAF